MEIVVILTYSECYESTGLVGNNVAADEKIWNEPIFMYYDIVMK